jgi:hypothetical protein
MVRSEAAARTLRNVLVLSFSAVTVACGSLKSGTAGKEYVRLCSDSDLNSKSVLYFGPSNQLGPGSVWIKLGMNGGYQPQWRVGDLGLADGIVQPGAAFSCTVSEQSQLTADAGLSVLSKVSNVSADLKSDFSRARSIEVSSTQAAWDTLIAGPFAVGVDGIKDGAIREDVMGSNRLVMRRALKLRNYKAVLDFDSSIKPEMQAKYSGKVLSSSMVGEVGAQLSATWTAGGKLELAATGDIYVAGEFAPLIKGRIAAGRGPKSIEDLGDKYTRPYQSRK